MYKFSRCLKHLWNQFLSQFNLSLDNTLSIVPSHWQILIIWFPLNYFRLNSQFNEPHEDKLLQLLCAIFQPALVRSQYANLLPFFDVQKSKVESDFLTFIMAG